MAKTGNTEGLLTVTQTARMFDISPESVYRAIRLGKLQVAGRRPIKISVEEASKWRTNSISN